MPHCYTALEELIYTFGGPWLFCLILLGLLVLLALVLSVARMKFVGADELPGPAPPHQGSQIDHSFPFLESLNEVILPFIIIKISFQHIITKRRYYAHLYLIQVFFFSFIAFS